jgi:hypothetical protein
MICRLNGMNSLPVREPAIIITRYFDVPQFPFSGF